MVINANVPQVLEFRKGIFPSISYDYFMDSRVKSRVPFGTRLVNAEVDSDRIGSAVAYGQGAFFLLGNQDETRLGNSYLGFIDSYNGCSLSKLSENIYLNNSFFLGIYDSRSNCKKNFREHLLLSWKGVCEFNNLYELEFGKTDIKMEMDKFGDDFNLVWSDDLNSYLIIDKNNRVFDSNMEIINEVSVDGFNFGEFVSDKGLVDKLINSPTYEDILRRK